MAEEAVELGGVDAEVDEEVIPEASQQESVESDLKGGVEEEVAFEYTQEMDKQDEAEEEEGEGKKSRKFKLPRIDSPLMKWGLKILIGLAVVLLQVGISYVIVTKFLMRGDSGEEEQDTAEIIQQTPMAQADVSQPAVTEPPRPVADRPFQPREIPKIGGTYTLADFVVNPANSRGQHFFVASIVFAFEDKKWVELIQQREPILKDYIIDSLGKRSFEWLSSYENKEIVRNEIIAIAETVLDCSGQVKVFFTKYVIQ